MTCWALASKRFHELFKQLQFPAKVQHAQSKQFQFVCGEDAGDKELPIADEFFSWFCELEGHLDLTAQITLSTFGAWYLKNFLLAWGHFLPYSVRPLDADLQVNSVLPDSKLKILTFSVGEQHGIVWAHQWTRTAAYDVIPIAAIACVEWTSALASGGSCSIPDKSSASSDVSFYNRCANHPVTHIVDVSTKLAREGTVDRYFHSRWCNPTKGPLELLIAMRRSSKATSLLNEHEPAAAAPNAATHKFGSVSVPVTSAAAAASKAVRSQRCGSSTCSPVEPATASGPKASCNMHCCPSTCSVIFQPATSSGPKASRSLCFQMEPVKAAPAAVPPEAGGAFKPSLEPAAAAPEA